MGSMTYAQLIHRIQPTSTFSITSQHNFYHFPTHKPSLLDEGLHNSNHFSAQFLSLSRTKRITSAPINNHLALKIVAIHLFLFNYLKRYRSVVCSLFKRKNKQTTALHKDIPGRLSAGSLKAIVACRDIKAVVA